jgi:signal transduction histidine kinase
VSNEESSSLETEVAQRKELERALREALRDRERVEEELRESVKREQEARARAERSDSFKEVFLGTFGHDLRNPLHTVLMTARLMTTYGELPPDTRKKVERIITSGVRMQRLIEQILDVARARLGDGIPIERDIQRDIGPLVARIVEETRAAHPGVTIELHTSPCVASVDWDRFEQVVSNLLGNAVTHGDTTRPIRVDVAARGPHASVSVQNHGKAIEPAVIPRLFDPFMRASGAQGRTAGVGLGLYISERIVNGHGGKIEVESAERSGTRFEAIFPR